mmetsp:Transcript_63739/g.164088  ORF Transcript_63739/g.164088 Transcript_63739/m.164088 type:complete len:242 (-) Transcript_63739:1158-1883(-)
MPSQALANVVQIATPACSRSLHFSTCALQVLELLGVLDWHETHFCLIADSAELPSKTGIVWLGSQLLSSVVFATFTKWSLPPTPQMSASHEKQPSGFCRSCLICKQRVSSFARHLPVSTSFSVKSSTICTALRRPPSVRSFSLKALALSLIFLSVTHLLIAVARSATVTLENCLNAMPTPLLAASMELSNWSKATGVMTVGTPLRRAAAVVPEPPWWTVAKHCGKSHSWGAVFTKSTLSLA